MGNPESTLKIPNNEYPVEAGIVNLLLGPHYQRSHHQHSVTVSLQETNGQMQLEDEVKIYWTVFEANNKKFLKILLQSIASKPIYQPEIIVSVLNGTFESYVEPITHLDTDEENNINEFVYRNVRNFGKGVNCAIGWNEDAKKVFTTFTPTVDVEKFSNEIADETINDICTLRNLSIWTTWTDEELIDKLREFVNGYNVWCTQQENTAGEVEGYQREKETILQRQSELLDRLSDNIEYLNDNTEALQCFKIANTAMLLQMVVARHPQFEKNREPRVWDEELDIYGRLDYFENAEYVADTFCEPQYRPFQLAFLLMNVKSTFEQEDPYRTSVVDLIWFPTGGGKTEAYLALTALTIVHRRRRGQYKGVSVIMRYTLRMLTSQQFERASYLICALEFLRQHNADLGLGNGDNRKISIGIYVGSGVTPNTVAALHGGRYQQFFNNPQNGNPFPISYCPWCGSRLVAPNGNHGYNQQNGRLQCLNQRCPFSVVLPVYYIDELIYDQKPTLLFATVDKFAQLYIANAAQLLNPVNIDSPDLIIQDELHLLVGALGSITGLFETVVEALISNNGRIPKIVASTATTRNTSHLIKNLFNRNVAVFPPQGLSYDDNYFSHIEPGAKRRHLGIMPSQNTNSNATEIRLAALLLLSRIKVFKKYMESIGIDWLDNGAVSQCCGQLDHNNFVLPKLLDNYWTSVFYFNSLKDLGRSRSRVSQEVFENFRAHKYLYQLPKSLSVLQAGFDQRVIEFTSRIDSHKIKGLLTKAESPVELAVGQNDGLYVSSGNDMIFASNMISVGIDIARWNLMVMVGQPRSTSEYVQSSSRVARNTYGLVINLMNPLRIREHSLFENYKSFHTTYYKSVEPLSITPLTDSTIKHKILKNIVRIYRNYILNDAGVNGDELAEVVIEDLFSNRFNLNDYPELCERLRHTITNMPDDNDFATSLRDITADAFVKIEQISY